MVHGSWFKPGFAALLNPRTSHLVPIGDFLSYNCISISAVTFAFVCTVYCAVFKVQKKSQSDFFGSGFAVRGSGSKLGFAALLNPRTSCLAPERSS